MDKKNEYDERLDVEKLNFKKKLIDKSTYGETEPPLAGIITKWSELVGEMRRALGAWLEDEPENGGRLSEGLDVWYRGVYSSQKSDENQAQKWLTEYALTPKVQRHDFNVTIEQERVMYLEFERLAEGIGAPNTPRYWSTYFKMQHYGMPTRLLDWTEGFLTALYFAVDAPKLSIENGI